MLVLRQRCSLPKIQLGRKNRHRLNYILQSQTTFIDSYILHPTPHQEARQTPFMLPSCLKARATPSHENADRAPSNLFSTRQRPLTPGTAPTSPAVPCSGYTHAHKTKKETRNKRHSRASIGKRRCRYGSSEMPGMYQPSTLREKYMYQV